MPSPDCNEKHYEDKHSFFLGEKERQQKLFFALEKVGLTHNLGMESGTRAPKRANWRSKLLQIASDCFAKKLAMTSSQ